VTIKNADFEILRFVLVTTEVSEISTASNISVEKVSDQSKLAVTSNSVNASDGFC
jgi:hypothetical protein